MGARAKIFSRLGLGPARRVVAIDPGSTCLKLVLAERTDDGVRILDRRLIDLREEGLLSNEEISGHLQVALAEWGAVPVALALPQHLAICQVVDLPQADPDSIATAIEAETIHLAGLSESPLAYDYTPIAPFARARNPFWLTLCRDPERRAQIQTLGLNGAELLEVTAAANGLINAWHGARTSNDPAVLVDFGARHTTVVIFAVGQGLFVGTFPIGSDAITQAIATERGVPVEAAETLKRTHNVFRGPERVSAAVDSVATWAGEVERSVREWGAEHPEPLLSDAKVGCILSGGGMQQPGLIEHLNSSANLRFAAWPETQSAAGANSRGRYAIAEGLARQTLSGGTQGTSLLPPEFRADAQRRQNLRALQLGCWALLLVVMAVTSFGVWQKMSLVRQKRRLLDESQGAVEMLKATEILRRQVQESTLRLQPALEWHRHTAETLEALAAVQQVRSNRVLWFVLFADSHSYFATPPRTATNVFPVSDSAWVTNSLPVRPGFIAELCIAEDTEATRRTLSQVVAELRQHKAFQNVDTLPPDAHRVLADPKLLLPDRCFSLLLEVTEREREPDRLSSPHSDRLIGPPLPREREQKPSVAPGGRTFKQRTNNAANGPEER